MFFHLVLVLPLLQVLPCTQASVQNMITTYSTYYHYTQDGLKLGPFNLAELRRKVIAGEIPANQTIEPVDGTEPITIKEAFKLRAVSLSSFDSYTYTRNGYKSLGSSLASLWRQAKAGKIPTDQIVEPLIGLRGETGPLEELVDQEWELNDNEQKSSVAQSAPRRRSPSNPKGRLFHWSEMCIMLGYAYIVLLATGWRGGTVPFTSYILTFLGAIFLLKVPYVRNIVIFCLLVWKLEEPWYTAPIYVAVLEGVHRFLLLARPKDWIPDEDSPAQPAPPESDSSCPVDR